MSEVGNLEDRWMVAGLSRRASRALAAHNVRRVSDLTPETLSWIRMTQGIGPITLAEIIDFRNAHTDYEETSVSEQNSIPAAERAVVPEGDGRWVLVLRDGPPRFAPCPGIKDAETAASFNKDWQVTEEQAQELVAYVKAQEGRAAAALAEEQAAASASVADVTFADRPAEEPCCADHAPGKPDWGIDPGVVFAVSFISAKLGASIGSIGSGGATSWDCSSGKHPLAHMRSVDGQLSVTLYEDHMSEDTLYSIMGYCQYHDIEVEAV